MINNVNIWEFLEKHFKEYPEDRADTSTEDEIEQAEKELGLSFNIEYKKFLKLYGGAGIGSQWVYGLKRQQSMGEVLWSVIENTKFFKETQKWPNIENWYVVSDDGSGNPIGIDPEGRVWLSDHDSGFEHIKLADSFCEFLYKLHKDTLYE